MQTGAITGYIDVAQLTLYAFWIFFAGLIFYLRSEDKREGYPLESDRANVVVEGFPPIPSPKTFILPHGGTVTVPRNEGPEPVANAHSSAIWEGVPIEPVGNPLLAGVGPGAWARRADTPDVTFEGGHPRMSPLRVATDFWVAEEDPDPRGMVVSGYDGVVAGTVSDVWVDRSEVVIRYLEVALDGGARSVLLPITSADIHADRRRIVVHSLLGRQFSEVPALKNPDQITLLEEDKVTAYYAAGLLFSEPGREEPIL